MDYTYTDQGGDYSYTVENAAFALVMQSYSNNAAQVAGKIIPVTAGAVTTCLTKNPKSGVAVYTLTDSFFNALIGETTDIPGLPWFLQFGAINAPNAY